MKFTGRLLEAIEDDAGLDARDLLNRVDLEDGVHVPREIQNDRKVAALTRQARSTAAGENRHALFVTKTNGLDDIILVSRKDDADRELAIIGRVRRVKRATPVVETDVAAKMRRQRLRQLWGDRGEAAGRV